MKKLLCYFLFYFPIICYGQIKVNDNGRVKMGNIDVNASSILDLETPLTSANQGAFIVRDQGTDGYFGVTENTGALNNFLPKFTFKPSSNNTYPGIGGIIEVNLPISQDILSESRGAIFFNTILNDDVSSSIHNANVMMIRNGLDPLLKLSANGNLSVKGSITANVNLGADFVFEDDYNLPSLSEVKRFVKLNKHLIGIQSEKEMIENGLNLTEFSIKLLQKIEELTLYVIELEEELDKIKVDLNENK